MSGIALRSVPLLFAFLAPPLPVHATKIEDVRGGTVNGSLVVHLDGERWDGKGLDLRTTNGSVEIQVPEHDSLRLETGDHEWAHARGLPHPGAGRDGQTGACGCGRAGRATGASDHTNGSVKVWRAG